MKVEGPGSLSKGGAAKRAGHSNGSLAGAFARALHGTDETATSGVNGAQSAGAVNPLLNLQEVEASFEAYRAAYRNVTGTDLGAAPAGAPLIIEQAA